MSPVCRSLRRTYWSFLLASFTALVSDVFDLTSENIELFFGILPRSLLSSHDRSWPGDQSRSKQRRVRALIKVTQSMCIFWVTGLASLRTSDRSIIQVANLDVMVKIILIYYIIGIWTILNFELWSCPIHYYIIFDIYIYIYIFDIYIYIYIFDIHIYIWYTYIYIWYIYIYIWYMMPNI